MSRQCFVLFLRCSTGEQNFPNKREQLSFAVEAERSHTQSMYHTSGILYPRIVESRSYHQSSPRQRGRSQKPTSRCSLGYICQYSFLTFQNPSASGLHDFRNEDSTLSTYSSNGLRSPPGIARPSGALNVSVDSGHCPLNRADTMFTNISASVIG